MIEPIPGWSWELRAEGVFLSPPPGEAAGWIRYVERARPLRPIREIVGALPTPPEYVESEMSSPERLLTVEGEYAALVTTRGTLAGRPVVRSIGCVFLDDYYALVGGLAWSADHEAIICEKVRQLLLSDRHHLGRRRRRFVYHRPRDWQGILVPPFHAYWIPRAAGAGAAILTVLPALPLAAQQVAARLLVSAGAPDDYDLDTGIPITADGGLSGLMFTTGTHEVSAFVAVLEDTRYSYPLLLTTSPPRAPEDQQVLLEVVRSVEAIPVPGGNEARPEQAAAIGMWDE